MAQNTSIEWTDATWNPVSGCTKVSPGCAHCYAERMAHRLAHIEGSGYGNGTDRPNPRGAFDVRLHPERLDEPLHWKKPRRIFVCSMGDLFHKAVPCYFIHQVFVVIYQAPQHTFQILTKRAQRLDDFATLHWPPNVWLGVTIENSDYTYRTDYLRRPPARVHFVSFEPLLGPIPRVDLYGVEWAIVGCESGPKRRPFNLDWARQLRDQCVTQGVKFFFKQAPDPRGNGKIIKMPLLDGKRWDEVPG